MNQFSSNAPKCTKPKALHTRSAQTICSIKGYCNCRESEVRGQEAAVLDCGREWHSIPVCLTFKMAWKRLGV